MNKNYLICGFLLIFFGILHSSEVNGQSRWRGFWKATSAEYDENSFIYVGFILPQYSYMNYTLEINPNLNQLVPEVGGEPDSFKYLESQGGSSVGFGFPVRLRINEHLSVLSGIKFMAPEVLNFSAKSYGAGPRVIYHLNNSNTPITRLQRSNNSAGENFNSIEIPLHLRLYSNKRYFSQTSLLNYRFYLIGGTNYLTHFGSNTFYDNPAQHENPEPPLIFKPAFWNLEGGLGFSLFTTYSKISFETRYTQSIGNILDHNKHMEWQNSLLAQGKDFPNHYMDAISKLGVRGWQFSIILE